VDVTSPAPTDRPPLDRNELDQDALRAARPEDVAAAAEAYGRLVATLEELHEEWRQSVAGRVRASGWQGSAGELATRTIDTTTGRLQAAQRELALVRDTLREAAETFRLARFRSLQQGPYALRAAPGSALEEAHRADRATAERLARLAARARDGRALDAAPADTELQRVSIPADTLGGLLGRPVVPPQGTSPTRVAAWWRGLDPDERRELTQAHPQLIGNLDGLPARDRDRANRLLLTRLLDRYEQQASPDRRLLEGLRAIQHRLAAEQGDVLLLGLGDQGQGRGILCFGDPDSADDVAVFVPGFGTELAAVGGGDADRAQRVRSGAAAYGQGRTTASMVWLGYDPPPNEGLDPRSLAVAGDGRAREGAVEYGRFLAGLRAARPGPPAHVTALGHSYGSLLVGLAAQQPGGPAADEVVLVGSPGTGARRAEQLGVGADHVYVGAAECDPVSRLPGASTVAARLETGGVLGAVAGQVLHPPDELWFGRDPTDASFGARRFEVAPGEARDAFASHSAYFDDSSESLANIARVVAGRGEEITAATGR